MILLPLAEEHLAFLLQTRNHESTRQFLENESIFNIEQCRQWFFKLQSPWYTIFVNEIPVGYIRTNGEEVGCDIHPNYRRRGYAREAYSKFLENVDRASLWVFEDNFAKSLYHSLGFKENGEKKTIRDRKYIKMIYEK